jgi:hypothetical protein
MVAPMLEHIFFQHTQRERERERERRVNRTSSMFEQFKVLVRFDRDRTRREEREDDIQSRMIRVKTIRPRMHDGEASQLAGEDEAW